LITELMFASMPWAFALSSAAKARRAWTQSRQR